MRSVLWEWMVQTWAVTLEAAPWLLFGFLAAGLIHAWVPLGRITRHLGSNSRWSVLKAAMIGAPLPLCSCSVIPVFSTLRRSGASRGAAASFLISTPETGVDSISLTYALLGPVMAAARLLAAVVSAVLAGVLVGRFAQGADAAERDGACLSPKEGHSAPERCCGADCGSNAAQTPIASATADGFPGRLAAALRYAFLDMFADLGIWLILGLAFAGLIAALVPDGFLLRHAGAGWLAMLVILVLALPLYVCATSSTPVAAALIAKGLSPGAALVFLLVGPATNAATMIVVAKELGRRGLAIYLLSIAVVAVALGLVMDHLFAGRVFASLAGLTEVEAAGSSLDSVAGLLLMALLLNGARLRYQTSLVSP